MSQIEAPTRTETDIDAAPWDPRGKGAVERSHHASVAKPMLRINLRQLDEMKLSFLEDYSFGSLLEVAADANVCSGDAWRIFEAGLQAAANFTRDQEAGENTCTVLVAGHTYWRNAEGALVPIETIRPADQLEDETVRKIIGYAKPLSAEISRFWQHTRDDIGSFVDLVLQQYSTSRGGKKGNITLTSFDGMLKVELRVAKLIEFGADLQAAKVLTDECLASWSQDSGAEIRTIVHTAFNVDKDGKVNQQALLGLLRHDFEDQRWKSAMEAIRNAIRVRATKEYFHFAERSSADGEWQPITLHLAKA